MDEISRQHELFVVGACPAHFEYMIRYVSIPIGEREVKFIPRYDGKTGVIIFNQPMRHEWADKGFLTNSFIDSSPYGKLCGDFEEMDGSYISTQTLGKMDTERREFGFEKTKHVIKFKLAYGLERQVGVKMIFFNLECLGEGEVDSFWKHTSYDK